MIVWSLSSVILFTAIINNYLKKNPSWMKPEALKKTMDFFFGHATGKYQMKSVDTPLLQQASWNDMEVLNFFKKTHCQEDQTAFYMNQRKKQILTFDYLHVPSLCVWSAFIPFLYTQERKKREELAKMKIKHCLCPS